MSPSSTFSAGISRHRSQTMAPGILGLWRRSNCDGRPNNHKSQDKLLLAATVCSMQCQLRSCSIVASVADVAAALLLLLALQVCARGLSDEMAHKCRCETRGGQEPCQPRARQAEAPLARALGCSLPRPSIIIIRVRFECQTKTLTYF